MIGTAHTLTMGHIHRHVPPASALDVRIAVLDIAQDFLLAHLQAQGIFEDYVVFKGGTALRKTFAGAAGRFSTDLDFAVRTSDVDRGTVAEMIAGACNVTLGPFTFQATNQRARWHVAVQSPFGNPSQTITIEVGPPCWLTPDVRPVVTHQTHARYGFALPALPTMRLEEILAEKVARLTRLATARDASDLVWAATTSPHSTFARPFVRHLAVLKVWVDHHGLHPGWTKVISPVPFDPDRWLAARATWDDESIGLLAHPAPRLAELEADLQRLYQGLRDLTPEEQAWAAAQHKDRRAVIAAIQTLPDSALKDTTLW